MTLTVVVAHGVSLDMRILSAALLKRVASAQDTAWPYINDAQTSNRCRAEQLTKLPFFEDDFIDRSVGLVNQPCLIAFGRRKHEVVVDLADE